MPDKEKKPQTAESEEKDRELFPDELDGVAGGVSDGEDKSLFRISACADGEARFFAR